MQVYLARMREALEDYESVAGDTHPEDFAYIPFHTPFPGMVREAGLLAYRHMSRGTDVEDVIAEEVGRPQPREDEYADRAAYEDAVTEYMEDLSETETYQAWYEAVIEPTLTISREVGNWYTGSVHVARASALAHAYEHDIDLAGARLGVGSYGSGAQAEVHAETVQDGWREEIAQCNVDDQLDARYDLTWEEYEDVHDAHNHDVDEDVEPFTTPDGEFVFDGWGRMGERKYAYVE
jgi:hydroxymethylglutaryl-CoA synthase